MSEDRRISVVIRYRDYRGIEQDATTWRIDEDSVCDNAGGHGQWTFDKVYAPKSNTREIFDNHVKEIVHNCLEGFNGTVFAYGQTASGKTFTMHGDQRRHGIIPYAVLEMFQQMSEREQDQENDAMSNSLEEQSSETEYLLTVSYLEIYNENVIDLLAPASTSAPPQIKLQDRTDGTLNIQGLTEVQIGERGCEEVFDCLVRGEKKRHIGETRMNERSSRSHTIFRLHLESRGGVNKKKVLTSVLHLVDLAGSEGLKRTQATGERRVEGANINKSLLSLTKVINQLSEKNNFVGFRESQLTRILQTSLGGNAQTVIIAAVSGAPSNYPETKSTLEFAARAKQIKNKVKVNVFQDHEMDVKRLLAEISQLKQKLADVTSGEKVAILSSENNELKTQREQILREKMSLEEQISNLQGTMPKILQALPGEKLTHTPRKAKEPNRRHTFFVGGKNDLPVFSSPISSFTSRGVNKGGVKKQKAVAFNGQSLAEVDESGENEDMDEDSAMPTARSASATNATQTEQLMKLLREKKELEGRIRALEEELQQARTDLQLVRDMSAQAQQANPSPLFTREERDSLLSQLQHLQENERGKEKKIRELESRLQWFDSVNRRIEQDCKDLEEKNNEQKIRIHDLEGEVKCLANQLAEREQELQLRSREESSLRDHLGKMGRDLNVAKQSNATERMRARSVEEELEKEKARKRQRTDSDEPRPGPRKHLKLTSPASPRFGNRVQLVNQENNHKAGSASSSSRKSLVGEPVVQHPNGVKTAFGGLLQIGGSSSSTANKVFNTPKRTSGELAAELQSREEFENQVLAQQEQVLNQENAKREAEFATRLAQAEKQMEHDWSVKVARLEIRIAELEASEQELLAADTDRAQKLENEINDACAQKAVLLEEKQDLEQKLRHSEKQVHQKLVTEDLSQKEREKQLAQQVEALQDERNELVEEVSQKNTELNKKTSEITHMEQEIEAVKNEKSAELEEMMKNVETVSAEYDAEIKEQAEKIVQLTAELDSLRQQLAASGENNEAKTNSVREENEKRQRELTAVREEKAALQAQLSCYQSQIADGRAAQARAEELEREIGVARAAAAETQQLRDRFEEKERQLTFEVREKRDELAKLEIAKTQLERRSQALGQTNKEEITRLQQQLLDLQEQKTESDAMESQVRMVEQLQQQVAKNTAELAKAYEKIDENTTEVARLTEELNNTKVELENRAKENMEVVGEAEKLLEETDKKDNELADFRMQKQKWERDAEEKKKLFDEREHLELQLTDLETQLSQLKKTRDDALTEVQRRNQEICSLQSTLTAESAKLEELQTEFSAVKIEKKQAEKLNQELQQTFQQDSNSLRLEKEEAVAKYETAQKQLQQSEQAVLAVTAERDKLTAQIHQGKAQLLALENEAETLHKQVEQAQAETTNYQKRLQEAQQLKTGFVEVEGALSQARVNNQDARFELNTVLRERDQFSKAVRELEEQLKEERERNSELEERCGDVDQIHRDATELGGLMTQVTAERENLKKQLQQAADARDAAKKRVEELEREMDRVKRQHVEDWLGSATTITREEDSTLASSTHQMLQTQKKQVEELRSLLLKSEEKQEKLEETAREANTELKRKEMELVQVQEKLDEQLALVQQLSSENALTGSKQDLLQERRLRERQQVEVERLRKENNTLKSSFREASREVKDYGVKSNQMNFWKEESEKKDQIINELKRELEMVRVSQAGEKAQRQSVLKGHSDMRSFVQASGTRRDSINKESCAQQ
ncbi:unnamed protein product [Amoebophrya sp. A120]|nr:unnamed protein product [Amoebophrya sp. A120]|eukprot:GSA120T00022712001.1